MNRLLVLLCAGLFLTLLIAGRDQGQARMGLTGAYDIAELKPLPVPAEVRAAPAAPQPAAAPLRAADAAAPAPRTGQTAPIAATPASFSPAPETASAGVQDGLTLALPLITAAPAADPEVAAVQTGAADAADLTQVGYVIGSNVNVREAPSAKAAVLGRLARGEAVTVLGEGDPGWSLIRIEGDGVEGFIATRYLAISPP